jgi:hypothetical protein
MAAVVSPKKKRKPDFEKEIKPFARFAAERILGPGQIDTRVLHEFMFNQLQAATDEELHDQTDEARLYKTWWNLVALPQLHIHDSPLRLAWKAFKEAKASPAASSPSRPSSYRASLWDLDEYFYNPTHPME